MCGIAGFLGLPINSDKYDIKKTLMIMANTLGHRGPDDSGCWFDEKEKIGLAHRRLSILDVSQKGHQPMISISGRYIISFNGEIYNHKLIRKELSYRSINWKGDSDTETLLSCIEIFGIEETLKKISGMFAFALWDRKNLLLTLARDKLGEKPLYYGWSGSGTNKILLFASELKSIKSFKDFNLDISRKSLSLLLMNGYIPSPYSIYKNIKKLEPASFLTVSLSGSVNQLSKYWDISDLYNEKNRISQGNENQLLLSLENILSNSIKKQMISDVPLGAFLSGGINSSLIVALMQKFTSNPVKTFTIGFDNENYNEAIKAKEVSKFLKTDHTELYINSKSIIDIIPSLSGIFCEPFGDPSLLPNFLISRLAKSKVTVAISGDGGDELFGGYERYFYNKKKWNKLKLFPSFIKKSIAVTLAQMSNLFLQKNNFYFSVKNYEKMQRISNIISQETAQEMYRETVLQISFPYYLLKNKFEKSELNINKNLKKISSSSYNQMMFEDLNSYLPDDILVKLDRTSMANSLETRVPFLDPNVILFSAKLNDSFKIRNGQNKYILRQLLYKFIDKKIVDKEKKGFSVPICDWLRKDLKDWAENLLDLKRLELEGFFNPITVNKMWNEHKNKVKNWENQLWTILVFQNWLEAQNNEANTSTA